MKHRSVVWDKFLDVEARFQRSSREADFQAILADLQVLQPPASPRESDEEGASRPVAKRVRQRVFDDAECAGLAVLLQYGKTG